MKKITLSFLVTLLVVASPVHAQNCAGGCDQGSGITAWITVAHSQSEDPLWHRGSYWLEREDDDIGTGTGHYSWRWISLGVNCSLTGAGTESNPMTGCNQEYTLNGCTEGYQGNLRVFVRTTSPTTSLSAYTNHWHNCDNEGGGPLW